MNCYWRFIFSPYYKTIKLGKERIGEFPIATSFERNQPRLLITALDTAEGVTVTFDSYKKEDGTMKTIYWPGRKYGYTNKGVHANNNNKEKNYEYDSNPIVIRYKMVVR